MNRKLFIFFYFILIIVDANGGGIRIKPESLTFNGYKCGAVFAPNQKIQMQYIATDYSYSGAKDNYEYIVFEIENLQNKSKFNVLQLTREYVMRTFNDFSFQVDFTLPQAIGEYVINYSIVPLFSRYAIGLKTDNNTVALDKQAKDEVKYFMQLRRPLSRLCSIIVGSNINSKLAGPVIYLQLDNRIPTDVDVNKLTKEIKFTWSAKNVKPNMEIVYRYRLFPDEQWSDWQVDNYVQYFLITKGNHEFQVECRYLDGNLSKVTNVARYSFNLDNPFLGQPEGYYSYQNGDKISFIDKGEIKRSTTKPNEIINKVYDNSYALLIGIDSYADKAFPILPYVNRDIIAVNNCFSGMGFTIKKPAAKKRIEILTAIRNTILELKKNDRLIIYISSHGFLDPINQKPLIATQDCLLSQPINAISIYELRELIKGAAERSKHILLIIDCCASGVGVMDKAMGLTGMRSLATQKGSHILTAGMSDQNAKMYEKLQMSVFTYYLTKGLTSKSADYTKDGIITLSELLIYVQFNVANYTNSAQIPICGRITGYGEPIFY